MASPPMGSTSTPAPERSSPRSSTPRPTTVVPTTPTATCRACPMIPWPSASTRAARRRLRFAPPDRSSSRNRRRCPGRCAGRDGSVRRHAARSRQHRGNDVRFGDIVAGCLLPGSCAERREVWLDNVTALGPELTKGYTALRDTFDADGDGSTAIVVMPSRSSHRGHLRDSPLDGSEHEFIYEFTTVLNQQLAASAAQAGVHFFADGSSRSKTTDCVRTVHPAINLIGRNRPTARSRSPGPRGHGFTTRCTRTRSVTRRPRRH